MIISNPSCPQLCTPVCCAALHCVVLRFRAPTHALLASLLGCTVVLCTGGDQAASVWSAAAEPAWPLRPSGRSRPGLQPEAGMEWRVACAMGCTAGQAAAAPGTQAPGQRPLQGRPSARHPGGCAGARELPPGGRVAQAALAPGIYAVIAPGGPSCSG